MALCLDRLGLVLDFEGQSEAGAARHQHALALARELDDRSLAASILASIGLGYWRQSAYREALGALHQALTLHGQAGDAAGLARTLVFIGRVHFKRGEYIEAKEHYTRAIAILTKSHDQRWLSIALEDQGDLALEQGFFLEALDSFDRSLAARQELGDRAGEVYMLTVIGRAYLLQAAYREALVWFDRAIALSDRPEARPGRALALYHLGIAYSALNEPAKALALYAEALTIKTALGDRRQQAWILGRMGDAHAIRRDYESALGTYGRATDLWEQIGDPRGTATGLSKAGRVYFDLGQYDSSVESFRRASGLFGASQPAFAASALAGMARAHAAAGRETLAVENSRRAADAARGAPDDVRWTTLRSLGWIERRFGRREAALAHFRDSLAIIETLRGRVVASADVREGFLEGKQAVYADTVELLVELGRVDEALEVAERSRARAFLDLLSDRELAIRPADRAARGRIASLEHALRPEAGSTGAGGSEAPGNLLDRERIRSELAAVSNAHPEAASLVTTTILTLAQIRLEARRTDATIVEYFSAAEQLHIWVLTPDGSIRARSSRISRRELIDLVAAVRASLGSAHDSRPILRQLFRVLVEPIADLLPTDRDRLITIIPHGPLFVVSFAALMDAEGRYFVERHTLSYGPSIGVLRYTGRNRDRVVDRTAPQLLAVGNPVMPPPRGRQELPPLPGAEREAATIGTLYSPPRVTILIGSVARERTIRELAPRQTIIHLATHAVVFDDQPMESYLALAPDSGASGVAAAAPGAWSGTGSHDPLGDGLLTVAEVFGLELRADLVTLSACDTGLGRVSGEGVVGLSRAFIYAGAASVLVSLWPVADTVADVEMERFYRELIQTRRNKAVALASAQRHVIALLRDGRIVSASGRTLTDDPLLWAPFVLIGEAR